MVADATRDQWGWLRVELLIQDLRYALRQLRKEPGFTLTVVVTLALGIGANTAIFTLVQGILLRSLPVNDPSRLYRIGDKNDCCYYNNYQNDNGDFDLFSYDLSNWNVPGFDDNWMVCPDDLNTTDFQF